MSVSSIASSVSMSRCSPASSALSVSNGRVKIVVVEVVDQHAEVGVARVDRMCHGSVIIVGEVNSVEHGGPWLWRGPPFLIL